jgi:hypothetical protein
MATCKFSDNCSFFKEEFRYNPHTIEFLCNSNCNGDFSTCARYKIALSDGIDNVPLDILPDPLKCLKCFANCDSWNCG